MCGCMLMHAAMDHEEQHHPASQAAFAPSVSSVRRCSHCSFPLRQAFAFCPNCGMPARAAQAQASLRTAECEACGQQVDPSWKACAHCGAPLGEAQAA